MAPAAPQHVLAGRPVEAVEVLAKVMAHKTSTTGSTRYAYAMALAKAGQREQALDQYRQAARDGLRWPDNLVVRWHLLWLQPWLRYLLIGGAGIALVAWAVLGRWSAQAWTLVVVAAVLIGLQRFFGRRK